jgi:hypothetical protein
MYLKAAMAPPAAKRRLAPPSIGTPTGLLPGPGSFPPPGLGGAWAKRVVADRINKVIRVIIRFLMILYYLG